jgi:hypothetical protein
MDADLGNIPVINVLLTKPMQISAEYQEMIQVQSE